MTTSEYIDFNTELGHRIYKTKSCYWYLFNEGYAHSFPTLDNVFPTNEDFKEIFKKNVKFLLFRSEIPEYNTFEYVFKGNSYDLDLFDSKTRNQIRKGLKSCEILEGNKETIKTQGLNINKETLRRQKRSVDYLDQKGIWEKYIDHFFNKKDIFIRCAIVNTELAGYAIFIKVNNKYIVQHPFRHEKYSSSNPMNAILFTFINDIILKEGNIEITYGLASFLDKPGLDKFKKAMLFLEIEASRLAVVSNRFKLFFNYPLKFVFEIFNKIKMQPHLTGTYLYLYNSIRLLKKHYKS